jgi:hypothetical protein
MLHGLNRTPAHWFGSCQARVTSSSWVRPTKFWEARHPGWRGALGPGWGAQLASLGWARPQRSSHRTPVHGPQVPKPPGQARAANRTCVLFHRCAWIEDSCPGESNPIRIPSRRAAGWLGWTCPTVCSPSEGSGLEGLGKPRSRFVRPLSWHEPLTWPTGRPPPWSDLLYL